jgi:hypothetical protein
MCYCLYVIVIVVFIVSNKCDAVIMTRWGSLDVMCILAVSGTGTLPNIIAHMVSHSQTISFWLAVFGGGMGRSSNSVI